MSAAVGSNPFARTSGFTQPADQTKSVCGFNGNIDFEQEKNRVDMRKSTGRDLNLGNPYVDKEVCINNFSNITQRVIEVCRQQSAANGLRGLRIFCRSLDKNQDGFIDPVEFKWGMKSYGLDITEDEMAALLKYFDTNRDGKISMNELMHAMRSNSLNDARREVVHAAYQKLDRSGRNCVTIRDLQANYDVTPNPQF